VEFEPQPAKEMVPQCPKEFSREERREYKHYQGILDNYGLNNMANATHLILLARTTAQYKECAGKVSKSGIIVKDDNGQPMVNPYWHAENKLRDTILKILGDLGLSSSGMAKLGSLMLKAKKQNQMEEMLD
jgi:P27 family predicted phage terminase small subunit